jgi:pSer/pThr/pTyr-binding forkhead associated (FHA) protein
VPYIVIKSNGQEIDRRELAGSIVIGRAPDCDVTLRDILLSRRHCRLEPNGETWTLHDLQSKNGTIINAERLQGPWVLQDNDVVRLGRAKIIFHAGLPDEDIADRVMTPARPADPGDSLAGTLSGFTLLLPGEGENPENMPCPQPRPKDPPAYGQEELQTLLSAIASSSWDSVYAEARQPRRNVERAAEEESTPRRRARPRSPMDFSLQVNPAIPEATEIGDAEQQAPEQSALEPQQPATVAVRLPSALSKPLRKFAVRPSLHLAVAALWIVALVVLNINRPPVARRAMGDQMTPNVISMPTMTPMDEQAITAASDQKSTDDSSAEMSEAAQKAPAPAAHQISLKPIVINELSARWVAENAASYLPAIAW